MTLTNPHNTLHKELFPVDTQYIRPTDDYILEDSYHYHTYNVFHEQLVCWDKDVKKFKIYEEKYCDKCGKIEKGYIFKDYTY